MINQTGNILPDSGSVVDVNCAVTVYVADEVIRIVHRNVLSDVKGDLRRKRVDLSLAYACANLTIIKSKSIVFLFKL